MMEIVDSSSALFYTQHYGHELTDDLSEHPLLDDVWSEAALGIKLHITLREIVTNLRVETRKKTLKVLNYSSFLVCSAGDFSS
jgi:hypothetical protein